MFDFMNIMAKVKEAQAKMQEIQANLGHLTTVAEAGAGLVQVTVNGQRQIVSIQIDPSVYEDKEMLQDLVVAATNKALRDIEEKIKTEVAQKMEGMLPNIPGLDLNSFMR